MRPALLLFFVALAAGCGGRKDIPTGLRQWDEAVAVASAAILHGDKEAFLSHIDKSGLPAEYAERFDEVVGTLKIAPNLRHLSTTVMTPSELEALNKEEDKDLPEVFRRNPLPPLRWNIQPERLIVFTFVSKDPNDKTTKVRWFAGAFQREQQWYFACCYP